MLYLNLILSLLGRQDGGIEPD